MGKYKQSPPPLDFRGADREIARVFRVLDRTEFSHILDCLSEKARKAPSANAFSFAAAGPTGSQAGAAGAGELRRREFQGMKLMALYKLCAAEGIVGEEELEDAMEGENPKERLVGLLMGSDQRRK